MRPKGRWTHENSAATKVNENKHIGIEPTFESVNRFGEKITGDQGVHVGADKYRPITGRIISSLIRTNTLARRICFRTPRKIQEWGNLAMSENLVDSNAGIFDKFVGRFVWLVI